MRSVPHVMLIAENQKFYAPLLVCCAPVYNRLVGLLTRVNIHSPSEKDVCATTEWVFKALV